MSDTPEIDRYNEWVSPDFSAQDIAAKGKRTGLNKLPTADDIQNIYAQSQEEGFNKGYAEGLGKATKEISESKLLINNIVSHLEEPFSKLSDEVIDKLKEISITIARQIIRREISVDPNNVIAAVKKSMDLLSEGGSEYTIYLNSLDVPIVNEILLNNSSNNITLKEDPSITRGGCKIISGSSTVDATIEEQIRIITSNLIGGSRDSDI